jgi:HTH-type transcriptional regulator / antitoxin HipB
MEKRIKVTSATTLGATLRALRKERGLNQAQAGRPTGVNQVTVSSIERGIPTRVDTLFRLLSALDLELVIQTREKIEGGKW